MPILTSTSYGAIRAAIDVTLDSEALPDAVIALPIYLDAADLEVKTRDPLWASRTGDALIQLTNAAIYLTAARLAPALPRLLGEDFGDYAYKLQGVDWDARALALRALADAALDSFLDVGDLISTRPTRFTAATGRRGRW
jgi:hypothetical protein